ncbi:autotransporter domain-containing protein [Sutterella faecalis]|uniref:Autotransporter domain-containing protein n=1 Tax=Sutterella faecalis TaxID=2584944 RepID=A0ABX5VBC9_9BURK|nr:autotransporter outer membrane beta-barrel domain-containing protein [Sutterella faecalis]QDA53590.1 autotransporter domain-containing protein [Sutterella faecalis]
MNESHAVLEVEGDVTANFDIAEGVTYTIGTRDAWKTDKNMDSIASSVYLKTAGHDNNVINKVGKGTLLMHGRMSDYYGTVNVNAGTFQVTSDWDIANTVTVNGGVLALENFGFTTVKEAAQYDGSAGGSNDDVVDDSGSIVFGDNGGQVLITGNDFDLSKIPLPSNAKVTFSGQTFDTQKVENKSLIAFPTANLQGGTVELQGVSVSNQKSVRGAGVFLDGGTGQNGSSLIVADSTFEKNTATQRGGAIEVNNRDWALSHKETVTIIDSVFSENAAESTTDYAGGALFIRGSDTVIENTVFRGNSVKTSAGYAEGGGAVYVQGWGQNKTFTQTGGAYEGNSVVATGNLSKLTQQSLGGAAITVKGVDATFTDVLFTNNVVDYSATDGKAAATGGAIAADYSTGSVVSSDKKGMAASVRIVATQDMAYTGNTIKSAKANDPLFQNYGYVSPMAAGGFLVLQRGSTAEFDVSAGKTLTLGAAGSSDANADSIASDLPSTASFNTEDGVSTLTKAGEGTLLINSSLNKYFGTTTVAAGTMQVASDWTAGNAITVSGGTLAAGSLTLTSLAAAFDAQTKEGASDALSESIKGRKASLAVNKGALARIDSLTLTNGTTSTISGTADIKSVSVVGTGSNFKLDNGTLRTQTGTVFTTTDMTALKSGLTFAGGVVELTDPSLETYTVSQLNAWQKVLNSGADTFSTKLSLVGSTLVLDNDDKIDIDDVVDGNLAVTGQIVAAKVDVAGSNTATIQSGKTNKDAIVKGISTEAEKVVLTGNGTESTSVKLTFAGDTTAGADINLIEGENIKSVVIQKDATLALGSADDAHGRLNADTTVEAGGELLLQKGRFTAGDISVEQAGTASVAQGSLSAEIVTLNGDLVIADETAASFEAVELVGTGNVRVGADVTGAVGHLEVETLGMTGGTIFLDPAWLDDAEYGSGSVLVVKNLEKNTLGTKLLVGQNSMAVIGADKSSAVAYAAETGKAYGKDGITAVLHVASPVKVTGAIAVDGAQTSQKGFDFSTLAAGTVTLAANSLTIIDTSAIGKNAVFDASSVTVDENAFIYLTNVQKTGTSYQITTGDLTADADSFFTKNKFVTFTVDSGKGTVTANALAMADPDSTGSKVIYGLYQQGMSGFTAHFLDLIGSDDRFSTVDADGYHLTAAGENAVQEFANAAVTSGIYNVLYDAQAEFTDSLARRMLEKAPREGFSAWADVYASRTKADTLYGSSGYSADIYGGVLGGDYAAPNGTRFGAALTVGTADAEAEDSVFSQKNDADFWGLAAYAAHDLGKLSLKADAGYLASTNDLKGAYAHEKVDASAYTFGVRADYLAYDAGIQVAPYIGLRYSRISSDDLEDRDTSDVNLVESPVGVAVRTTFSAEGWTIAPKFDLSVVPQLGDKEVDATIAGVNVASDMIDDALGHAQFGVSAVSGNLSLGLDYRFGFGAEDRGNHALKASVRYAF